MADPFIWPSDTERALARANAPAVNAGVVQDAVPFIWPYSNRTGIRYGNLTQDQLAALPPVMQQRLPDRASTQSIVRNITEAGTPELTMADPVLPPQPSSGPGEAHIQIPALYNSFSNLAISIGAVDVMVLTQPPGTAKRTYLFIVNSHPTQYLYVAFQVSATLTLGLPIQPNFGFVEYNVVVPQDDVHIIANGAATTGVVIFANKTPNQPD